jgi:release factor glutamine methyltransferase
LSPERTIGDAQSRARRTLAGISETPTLDTQLLLADLLGQPRAWVLAHPEYVLAPDEDSALTGSLARLAEGEPLPYVLGWWEFYGRRFVVTPAVLIPRPETELLVERALHIIRSDARPDKVVEVGTGSGCVVVSLAAEVSGLRVIATDVSDMALEVCHENSRRFGVGDQVDLVQADLLQPFTGPFDLVLANLPYIPSSELGSLSVSEREPGTALDGGKDGLELLRRILDQLRHTLSAAGAALLEIGAGQGPLARAAASSALPDAAVKVISDLAGRDRLLEIRLGRNG